MPDISKIILPNVATPYDIKDSQARTDIENLKGQVGGGVHYLGVTTTELTDGASTNPIGIGGKTVTAVNGDLVIYSTKEFIFSVGDNRWHEFGDRSMLGTLAFKDSASGSYTPAGSVSGSFSGSSMTSTGKFTPSGSITTGTGAANYTPAGTISVGNGTANYTPAGTISVGTGTANYTPAGSLSGGAISVTPSTVTKYVATSESAGGSVTAGKAASCTLPTLAMSVGASDETLTIAWTAGSFTANTPTAVTMPSFASQTIATGISSASITTEPTFTGTGAQLKFTGTGKELKFTGTGTQLKFNGSQGDVSVSGTTTGSITGLGFTGTGATVTVS